MKLTPVIGLEIHVELDTKSKMFCSCTNDPTQKDPNVNVCPVCMGHPGTLPVANKEAIKSVVKVGMALNCKIADKSKFDRKSYFYPDLPKGYQISQFYIPFCQNGYLDLDDKKIKIREIHLEEDTGRLVHSVDEAGSMVDYDRAGVPLMELVTDPDMSSAKEARKFAEELQLICRYLGVSNADMEKGQMRIEANISLSKDGKMGTKVEIKNLNSFKSVEGAIDYELERQRNLIEHGEEIVQETRGWTEKERKTKSQRSKEEAHDYRYFPEPDLPVVDLKDGFFQEAQKEIPELPQEKRNRFKTEYALDDKEIEVFVGNKDLSEYFEQVMSELRNWVKESDIKDSVAESEFRKLIRFGTNYLLSDLQGLLKGKSVEDDDFKITAENFAEFITLLYKGQLSSKIAKIVLADMYATGADPSQIIKKKDLVQIDSSSEIETIAQKVISNNPKPVDDFKNGKEAALQFLVGQLMKETKGKVNPQKAGEILKKLLK